MVQVRSLQPTKDGTMSGYDLDLAEIVDKNTSLPIILQEVLKF